MKKAGPESTTPPQHNPPVSSSVSASPQPSSLNSQPPQIPDHELLRRIGTGSYGEVWLARSVLGTLRAIKVVHRARFDHEQPYEREFKGIQKFEPISRSHEGLVDVLQVGRNDAAGYFYYVMELADAAESVNQRVSESVSGPNTPPPSDSSALTDSLTDSVTYSPKTLRSDLKRRTRLPVSECLDIGLALASALGHLHKNDLVHRDIKPSNIIFVGGAPKLADIGLVADISEARSFVGTTGFIPPEGPGTAQADLYSLGKVLYEISTGHDRHEFPALPPDLRELPDTEALIEFNEIVVKACAQDPRRRYSTADQLQADLLHLQRGQSVIHKHARVRQLKLTWQIGMATAAIALLVASGWLFFQRVNRVPVAEKGTANLQANNEYQLGRFFWGKRTGEGLTRAIDHFRRATELDPRFPRAYAGLADCYNLLAEYGAATPGESKPKARETARRALALDDRLAEAHASLAKVLHEYDHDWATAEQEYKRAIELNPNYSTARHWYGIYLDCLGRSDEAIAEIRKAVELDPLSLIINANLGYRYFFAHRYDEAIRQLLKTSEMDPTFPIHSDLGWIYKLKQMNDEAIAVWQQGLALSGESPETLASLREAYRNGGMKAYLEQELERRRRPGKQAYESLCFRAFVHAHLGQNDEAMGCLESAYQQRDPHLTRLHASPICDPLRSDPRFVELFRKMGLAK